MELIATDWRSLSLRNKFRCIVYWVYHTIHDHVCKQILQINTESNVKYVFEHLSTSNKSNELIVKLSFCRNKSKLPYKILNTN